MGGAFDIQRFAAKPVAFTRKLLGYAHYIVALAFLLTSPRLRSRADWLRLGALALAAVALCAGIHALGGYGPPATYIVAILYFVYHAVRDESFLYRLHARATSVEAARGCYWMEVAAFSALVAFFAPIAVVYFQRDEPAALLSRFQHTPFAQTFLCFGLPFIAVAGLALLRVHRAHPRDLQGVAKDHRPLVCILVLCDAFVLGGVLLTGSLIEAFIVFHFVSWLCVATRRIAEQPLPVRAAITWRTPGPWLKRTHTGFWVLHGGIVVATLAVFVVAHWILPEAPMRIGHETSLNSVAAILGDDFFYHATMFHVTLSFMPR